MKFDFLLAKILNCQGFAGSGLRLLSKIRALAHGRAGLTALSSHVRRAHDAAWSVWAPASPAPEKAPGNAMLTGQRGTGRPHRAAAALTQEPSGGFAGFGVPRFQNLCEGSCVCLHSVRG